MAGAVHLLAAMTSGGAVIARRDVEHKTNEITQVKPLLDPLDITGAVVTLDAMHARRETARYLVKDKHADYLLTAVKDNQPSLFDALDAMPGASAPIEHVMKDRGHGRDETWQSPENCGDFCCGDLVCGRQPRSGAPRVAGAGLACPFLPARGTAEVSGVRAGPQGRRVSDAQQP